MLPFTGTETQQGLYHFELFFEEPVKMGVGGKRGETAVVALDDSPSGKNLFFVKNDLFHVLTDLIQHAQQLPVQVERLGAILGPVGIVDF